MPRVFAAAAVLFCSTVFAAQPPNKAQAKPQSAETLPVLTNAIKAIRADLNKLDRAIAEAAERLSTTDLADSSARAILTELRTNNAGLIFDVCTVSPRGIIMAVEPEVYRNSEGVDITSQAHVQELLAERKPVMSQMLRAVEGMYAAIIAHPVFDKNKIFLGSINAVCSPAEIIGRSAQKFAANTDFELWAMQPDGFILYDADSSEIGRMVFTDPVYQPFTDLLQISAKISKTKEGCGVYSFFKDGAMLPVQKDASWGTITLHGADWRVILAHLDPVALEAAKAKADAPPVLKPYTQNDVRRLANDLILLRAIDADDKEAALQRLGMIASKRSGIYSLSWIDGKGINRFGFPPERSMENVDLRAANDNASKLCVEALDSKREASFEEELIEGGRANFFVMPILKGRLHRGAMLWIQKIEP